MNDETDAPQITAETLRGFWLDKALIQKTIAAAADDIKQRLVGGTVYGLPIDPDNVNMLVVGAYGLAQAELGRGRRAEDLV